MSSAGRVVWVSTALDTRGGVSSYVRAMQQTPLWQEWSVRLVATHQDGSAAQKVLRFARGALQLWWILLARRPQVVHLHTASYGSFARKSLLTWSARSRGVPVVLHVHGAGFQQFYEDSPRLLRGYIRGTLRAAAAVVALGPTWGRWIQDTVPTAHVVVVPNAVPIPARAPQPSTAVVGADGRDAEPLSVVFLGRLGERKGTPVLLAAWEGVQRTLSGRRPVTLTLAGDGAVEQAREVVRTRGLQDDVRVLGWVSGEDAAELLDGADVLVLPSQQEGQPMAVLEAMARGVCVVATHVGGIPDLVADGESGLLVPPDDVAGLTRALELVLTDDESRRRLGRAGRERAERDFDLDRTWRTLDRLYREVAR